MIDGDDLWEFLVSIIFGASETVETCSSWTAVVTGEWEAGLLDSTFVFNWSKLENVVTVDEDFNIICWNKTNIISVENKKAWSYPNQIMSQNTKQKIYLKVF